jgi:hypothetical protein
MMPGTPGRLIVRRRRAPQGVLSDEGAFNSVLVA